MDYKVGILLLSAAVLALIIQWTCLAAYSNSTFGQIDRCYYDRYNDTQHQRPGLLPKFLFWSTIICFVLLSVRAHLNPPAEDLKKKKDDSLDDHYLQDLVFYLGTGTTFYSVTYCLSKVIEYFLDDTICSRHLNGISGHYLFHLYFVFLFFYLRGFFHHFSTLATTNLTFSKVLNTFLEDVAYVILLGAAAFFSLITLSWTLLGGFHSPRQILYGILLSLLSHYVFVFMTEKYLIPVKGSKHRVQAVMGLVVGLVVLLLVSTAIGKWPFTTFDFIATVVLNAATVFIAAQD